MKSNVNNRHEYLIFLQEVPKTENIKIQFSFNQQ